MLKIKDFKIKDYDTLVKELQAKASITEKLQYWHDEVYNKVCGTRELLLPILKHANEQCFTSLDIPESIWIKYFEANWNSPKCQTWYYEEFKAKQWFEFYKKKFYEDYDEVAEEDRIEKINRELEKLEKLITDNEKKELERLKFNKSSYRENPRTDFTSQVKAKYILFKKYLLSLLEKPDNDKFNLKPDNDKYDLLKKLSEKEKKDLKVQTFLRNQETITLFIHFLRKTGGIGQISNDKAGILFHHLTGYSANTLGDSLSQGEIDDLLAKDKENGYKKLRSIQSLLGNIHAQIDEILNEEKPKNKNTDFQSFVK